MKMRNFLQSIITLSLSALALAQGAAAPTTVTPTDAKNHVGEIVTICGKVVDSKINKYGIPGHGKPVMFDLDKPEPDSVFYFVTFGTKEGGPDEAIAAYKDKNVCVSGKIIEASNKPYIMAADRTNIKVKSGN